MLLSSPRVALVAFISLVTLCDATLRPSITILVEWSSVGDFAWGYRTDLLTNLWSQHLTEKFNRDPSWPFNATVELFDVQSNFTLAVEYTTWRISNPDLPPVTIFVAPEGPLGIETTQVAESFNIPSYVIMTSPSSSSLVPFPGSNQSYFTFQQPMYMYRAVAETFFKVDVKTVVTVAAVDSFDGDYSFDSCIMAGRTYFKNKGIKVLEEVTYILSESSYEDMIGVATRIKNLNPDAVMWCDDLLGLGVAPPEFFGNALFEAIDYTPKAMAILDCTGVANTQALTEGGYLDYLLQPTYFNPKFKGRDYTNDAYSYSNVFQPPNEIKTIYDAINMGSLSSSPSSAALFDEYILKHADTSSTQYVTVSVWAAFELLESAIYRATQNPVFMSDGQISGQEIFAMMEGSQMSGPYGRVGFDGNRINTYPKPILMQFFTRDYNYDIVYPVDQATHEIVYPIPTWKERKYTWSLMKGNVKGMIALVSILTFIVFITMITIMLKRKEENVSRIQNQFRLSICLFVVAAIWSLVFAWQADNVQAQCSAYLWATIIPISFVLSLLSMMAFRLSLFLTSQNKEYKKKWTYGYALMWAGINVCGVALVLLIFTQIDPPKSTLVIVDKYRPIYNYYTCTTGKATNVIMFLLFSYHVILSIVCTIRVRKATGMFSDGNAIKECFIVFYSSCLFAFVMSFLDISNQTIYVLRTASISFGLFFTVLRLLSAKYIRYWIPEIVLYRIKYLYNQVKYQIVPSELLTNNTSGNTNNSDAAVNSRASVISVNELLSAIEDKNSFQQLKSIAKDYGFEKSIEFLKVSVDFKKQAVKVLHKLTIQSNHKYKDIILEIINKFVVDGSDQEINISSRTKDKLLKLFKDMDENEPMIGETEAALIVHQNQSIIIDLFETSQKSILATKEFQEIWKQFKEIPSDVVITL